MRCPMCGGVTNIIDTRQVEKYGNSIRRRRLCWKCRNKFTTYEVTPKVPEEGENAKDLLSQIGRYVKEGAEK